MTNRRSKSSVFIGHTKNKNYRISGYKIRKRNIIEIDYKINYLSNKEVRNKNKTELINLILDLSLEYEKLKLTKIKKNPSDEIFILTNSHIVNSSTSKLVNFFLQTQAKIKVMEYLDF